MKSRSIFIIFMIMIPALFLLIYSLLKPRPTYVLKDLGIDNFKSSSASSVNDTGQVVGISNGGAMTHIQGFVRSQGKISSILANGGDDVIANSINIKGACTGYLHSSTLACTAFIYDHAAYTKIGTFGGKVSQAFAINNQGDVVGAASDNGKKLHAFLFKNKKLTDLGSLAGGLSSSATGINNHLQICGTSQLSDGSTHAFLRDNGSIKDLGTLGGPSSFSTAINDSGEVVGYAELSNVYAHAFAYKNGALKDLGTLPMGTESYAYGINREGTIVGSANDSHGVMHAMVFAKNKMQDLNNIVDKNAGWVLSEARGINNSGVIVGKGFKNGEMHAFMVEPIRS